jgi:hypothetical protein
MRASVGELLGVVHGRPKGRPNFFFISTLSAELVLLLIFPRSGVLL